VVACYSNWLNDFSSVLCVTWFIPKFWKVNLDCVKSRSFDGFVAAQRGPRTVTADGIRPVTENPENFSNDKKCGESARNGGVDAE
jgi:hypothetical protein